MVAVANKRKKLRDGRVIRFKDISAFLERNGGARAVAHQTGGTYAILARNGNCTPLFNSDPPSMQSFVAKYDPVYVPIK